MECVSLDPGPPAKPWRSARAVRDMLSALLVLAVIILAAALLLALLIAEIMFLVAWCWPRAFS
jgi:hypothetical protein